jgi:GDPmannose 4,6-dehydratase
MFTHTGPRRGDVFVVSNFAKQIAAIEAGLASPVVKVGNLESIRTFTDVRDAVRAYWLLVTKCAPGEVYNIGGVETMNVGEMLNRLLGLSSVKNIKIEVDPDRLRPSDVTLQIPSTEKFYKETGWKPEIKFEQTMEDTLNYWREYYITTRLHKINTEERK